MVNGAAKYMPDASAYDKITYEAMNSSYARGSAETLAAAILKALKNQAEQK
jgi:neutral ceramidase